MSVPKYRREHAPARKWPVPVDPRELEGESDLSGCNSLVQGPDGPSGPVDPGLVATALGPVLHEDSSPVGQLEGGPREVPSKRPRLAPADPQAVDPWSEACVEACLSGELEVAGPLGSPGLWWLRVCVPRLPLAPSRPPLLQATPSSAAQSCLITRAVRLELLGNQGPWLADDQIRAGLDAVADHTPAGLLALAPDAQTTCLLSGLYVEGHWILFAWQLKGDRVSAWASHPMTVHSGPATVAVAAANFCAARLLGRGQESFDFCGGPDRPFCSGACGALALADLLSHLLGQASVWR